jgi:multiple sugar transport system substrate-binding protein
MRKWILLIVVVALAMGAMGVVAQDDLSAVDPAGTTIQYWHQYNSGAQLDTMNAFIEDFNTNNEWGITVEGTPQGNYGDISTLMNNSIVSGDLPNLVAGFNNNALSYALDDVVVDLEPYFSDATWGFTADEQADLNADALNIFVTPDGQRIGWVNQLSAYVLAVNTGLLTELGFDGAPKTLDEFKEVACAAATSGLTGAEDAAVQGFPIVADASQFESFVAGIGGSIWADGAWDFTNEKSVQVLQFLQDLYSEGCAYIPGEAFGNTADFARGTNPMALGSTAGIPFIRSDVEAAGNVVTEWAVTTTPPLAEGDASVLQLLSPGIIAIEGTPEENLASWLFIKFLASPENQVTWTTATSYFPISKSAAAELGDLEAENPYFATINQGLANGTYTLYSSPQQLSYGAVREILATGIADVVSNGMDVAEVAQRMTDDANAALEEG